MYLGKTLFAQAMDFLPWKTFYRIVNRYGGDHRRGTKPGDIPVEQPTKFDLVINLKNAKALGLSISDKMLALADELIE